MENPPVVTVAIPAYNESAFLGNTLASVHQSFAAIFPTTYEIVVCDNNSSDQTASIAGAAGARVVFEPHNQIAKARNTAARDARGKWLIFLDADTLLNAAVLRATLAAFESGKIAAGGATLALDKIETGWASRVVVSSWLWLWNRISCNAGLAAGSYVYCTRQAWFETGGFDEERYVTEELAFSKKLKAWCATRKMVFHIIHEASITTSSRKLQWYGTGQLLKQAMVLAVPGAMRRADRCQTWYRRPSPTTHESAHSPP